MLLFEKPLTHGGCIRVLAESFAGPPSLRLEKVIPGRAGHPINFVVSSAFATEFAEAVATWLERIDVAKAHIKAQRPLDQRANRVRGGR